MSETNMSDIPKLWERAEPVPYSSVVGQSVLLFHESGKVTCQLALVGCELERTGQTWLAQMLCDALNAYQSDIEINAELVGALRAADAAINPADRDGISLHEWNGRLKAATAQIRTALAKAQGETP